MNHLCSPLRDNALQFAAHIFIWLCLFPGYVLESLAARSWCLGFILDWWLHNAPGKWVWQPSQERVPSLSGSFSQFSGKSPQWRRIFPNPMNYSCSATMYNSTSRNKLTDNSSVQRWLEDLRVMCESECMCVLQGKSLTKESSDLVLTSLKSAKGGPRGDALESSPKEPAHWLNFSSLIRQIPLTQSREELT